MDKVHDVIAETLVFAAQSQIPQMLRECRVADVPHESLMLKDSLELTDADREAILQAVLKRPETGIVITHGTSTMTATAAYLNGRTDKTIILTGAMRPFSFFQSDAGFNLGAAMAAAQACAPGIYIAMNGRVFPEGTVRKNEAKGIFEEV